MKIETDKELSRAFIDPFPPNLVSFKIGSRSRDKTKVKPLAYIDARDVMRRLDDVMGVDDWQDSYKETPSGRIICELSIWWEDDWITKSDGAGDTTYEGEKGAISDAFKRAAVKFGIGRYLYDVDAPWIKSNSNYLTEEEIEDLRGMLPLPFEDQAMQMLKPLYRRLKSAETIDDFMDIKDLEETKDIIDLATDISKKGVDSVMSHIHELEKEWLKTEDKQYD